MRFDRVVCYVDGSPHGLEALRQACLLREPEGDLLGVVACDLGLAAEAGFEAAHAARQLEEEAELARSAALAELDAVPSAAVKIVKGRPAAVLLGAARKRDAELLVIGRRGSSPRRGPAFGHLTSEMIHRAPCSVLVARVPADGGLWLPQTLTVGIDGSDCSLDALAVARALGQRLDARVRVLTALGGKPVDAGDLRRLGDIDVDKRRPAVALAAASRSSELVVVGSRGLHGFRLLGSVSERVAHRSVCSVLVVRRGATVEPG
jgi:nucleotide-binding universal stress UspA family protein